ncbi:hypothetical protein K2173_017637 [Erythroxylum novogranatense]|uniref:Uncharacterized protein n=1 Tax=Erythroxylum novogranatense TaxID=1862640 RepID=A0AAV8SLI8_9ROSI|nr:hypothetical protein K2173_017637 [Erythroxylum novogranatense]
MTGMIKIGTLTLPILVNALHSPELLQIPVKLCSFFVHELVANLTSNIEKLIINDSGSTTVTVRSTIPV